MRKIILLFLLSSCSPSPTKVFEKMEKAAIEGKIEEFRSYFTEDSAPFAEALLRLHKNSLDKSESTIIFTRSKVLNEIKEDKRTILEVETNPQGEDPKKYKVAFVKQNGKWRIDLLETDKINLKEE